MEDVATVRSMMKNRGIKKTPGVSNVELNNRVHTFLAGDRSHPQSKKIYEELDVLVSKMKELGYVPGLPSTTWRRRTTRSATWPFTVRSWPLCLRL